jgi:hypothetical protein
MTSLSSLIPTRRLPQHPPSDPINRQRVVFMPSMVIDPSVESVPTTTGSGPAGRTLRRRRASTCRMSGDVDLD